MKTLVFSDTHLSSKFEEKKYKFLKSIIQDADKVIINGDFWDSYFCSFEKFINSKWKSLFPLLKSKNAVYLYGNHDLEEKSDEKAGLFSDSQTESCELEIHKRKYLFEHGHRRFKTLETVFPLLANDLTVRLGQTITKLNISLFGENYIKMGLLNNKKIKKRVQGQLKSDEILVTGHTHAIEKDDTNSYINCGFIGNGFANYIVIKEGDVELKMERY